MKFPELAKHPEMQAALKRLQELKIEGEQLEATLRAYRDGKVEAASLEQRAELLANGFEPDEPAEPVEARVERVSARLELVNAAISVQARKVAEVRERVGYELVEQLRPQYEPIVADIVKCVVALSKALEKNRAFGEAMTAAGLPWGGAIPLGGHYKRPGLCADFGTPDGQHCYAAEFMAIAKEFGYLAEKEVSRAVA